MALPNYETTEDGFEKQWGVNHLGHFYLTTLLMDKLLASAPSRIVNVSSSAHEMSRGFVARDSLPPKRESYSAWVNYGISKTSNILFAKALNEKYSGQGVTSYALHPGVIPTELTRNMSFPWAVSGMMHIGRIFMKSIPQVLVAKQCTCFSHGDSCSFISNQGSTLSVPLAISCHSGRCHNCLLCHHARYHTR